MSDVMVIGVTLLVPLLVVLFRALCIWYGGELLDEEDEACNDE